MLGAGISAEAAEKVSKVAINDENFAWAVKEYADQADTNKDGFLSKKEASKITSVEFNSPYNIDSLKGIEYFTEIKDFTYQAYDASGDYGRHKIYENSTVEEIDLSGFKKAEHSIYPKQYPLFTDNKPEKLYEFERTGYHRASRGRKYRQIEHQRLFKFTEVDSFLYKHKNIETN